MRWILVIAIAATLAHGDDWDLSKPDKVKHVIVGSAIGGTVAAILPRNTPWWTRIVLGIVAAEVAGRLKEFADPVASPADVHATRIGGAIGAATITIGFEL